MKKFTLIELLFVIAIIGILSSLVLPSVRESREKGLSSVCMSNLRQSHIRTFLYTADNDLIMHMYDSADSWGGWATKLEELYIPVSDRSSFCPKTTPDLNSPLLFKQKTYGGNYQALYKQFTWDQRSWMIYDGNNYYKKMALLPKTSDYIFLGDTMSKGIWQNQRNFENHSSFGNGDWAPISTTHNFSKGANALYVDGHAQSTSIKNWRTLTLNNTSFDFTAL